MKVNQLIEQLQKCNPEDDVIIWDGSDNGYGEHIGHLNIVVNGRAQNPEAMEPFDYVAVLSDEGKGTTQP